MISMNIKVISNLIARFTLNHGHSMYYEHFQNKANEESFHI